MCVVRVCVSTCMYACVCLCMHACVCVLHVCMRVCVCVCSVYLLNTAFSFRSYSISTIGVFCCFEFNFETVANRYLSLAHAYGIRGEGLTSKF